MEYPSGNDFFLKFKPIFNSQGLFLDYVLIGLSNNFFSATKIKIDRIIGERISSIISEEGDILGLKNLYDFMVPNVRRKLELEIEELNRWYMVNIFSDERDYLLLFFSDITRSKNFELKEIKESDRIKNNVYDISEMGRIYYKDYLTGLYNRAFFNEELSRLDVKRQLPLTVIMGDVNSLKLINDAFGHEMGDKTLIRVGEIMKKNFREEDIISRIGGDEFAILLPRTTEEVANKIVDRIKMDCAANPLEYLIINISFGVATKVMEDEDISKIIQKADNRMYYMKIKENKEAKLELIKNFKKRLEDISFETSEHYKRLEQLSMMMADKLNLGDRDREELRLLCEFHDIGKVGIPDYILQKEGSLNNDEWEDVKRHSEIGYHLVKGVKNDLAVNDLILIHHERWDGNGYPGFLKNDEIPLVVRIFSIADAYEAMVNDRPYKNRISRDAALKEILDKAGTQFDPNLAEMFVDLMKKKVPA